MFLYHSAGGGRWSTSNVVTDEVVRGEGGAVQVRCLSTHLTSFAVLVDVTGSGVSRFSLYIAKSHKPISSRNVSVPVCAIHVTIYYHYSYVHSIQSGGKALKIVSYIGLGVSLACLLVTIIFFLTLG